MIDFLCHLGTFVNTNDSIASSKRWPSYKVSHIVVSYYTNKFHIKLAIVYTYVAKKWPDIRSVKNVCIEIPKDVATCSEWFSAAYFVISHKFKSVSLI